MNHNRIIALALILAALLAPAAMAAAGDADDPLISRSYAEGAFRTEVSAALDAVCGRALARAGAVAPAGAGWTVRTLTAGDSVTLRDGQQLILISGGVRLTVRAGRLINCTLGRDSVGGDARTGHRYVAWDGAEVLAECADSAVAAFSAGAESDITAPPDPVTTPAPEGPINPFTDVAEGAWYYADLLSAVRRGLVNGMTPTTYEPAGQLTLAQAVKLAACMRQLRDEGAVRLKNADDGRDWYMTYADYALVHGILDAAPDSAAVWNAMCSRADFVRLFYRALPEADYAPVNDIPDGSIPDVAADDPVAREVYAFYAAGILTGYAEGNGRAAHEFGADTPISRAEVAVIMNRMFEPEARLRFEMG